MNIIIPSNKIYKTTIDSKVSDNRFGKIVVNMDSHSVEDKQSTILETVKIDAATSGTSFSDYEGKKSSANYEQEIFRYLYAGFDFEYLSSQSTKFSINRFGDYYIHDYFTTYISDINFKITSSVIKTSFQVASNGTTITFNTGVAKAQETNQSTFTLNSKNGYEFVELFSGNASSQNLISFKFTDIYNDPYLGITSDKKDQSGYELRVSKWWRGDDASFWKNHFYVSHEVKDDKIDITLHYTPKLKFYAAAWFGSKPSDNVSTIADGVLFELVPQSVTIGLNSKFKSIKKGEIAPTYRVIPEHNTFSIKGKNELLQYESLIDGEYIMYAFTPIVDSWKNGKETATLLCSVGDYYDENGNRVVSTETADKMTFNLYDEVLPLYRTPLGDAPMSMADGKPKIFKVLGSKVYFDGAVWQEISLQESGTTDYIVQNGTRGLSYALRDDGGSYYCAGIGDATESEISIASLANGVPVDSIGYEAFRDNQQIKSAVIPNGISRINAYAFFQSGLLSVELPDTLQYIGDVAFAESQLTKIEIPQSVSQIELGAFNHCNNLNTAIIKANIDKIEDAAFSDCHNLRTVKFPSTVKKIGKMSFMNAAFDSIELGNVQEIGESAFRNCLNLKNVNLKSCTSIGQWAFGGTNLTEVDARSVQYIGASAFNGCANLKKANIDGCIEIGNSAFVGTGLTEIVIPPSVKVLANAAFGCPYLENVYYNATNADDSTAFVGGSAFTGAGSGNGSKIRIGKNVERIPGGFLWTVSFTGEQSNISSVVFEEGSVCKEIGGSAFRQVQFSTLELPDSVKTIGANCFYSSSLATLTANGVEDVGDYAFNGCSQLQNIALTNVAHIGDWAFQNCSALQEISLDKITSIGTYAFIDCVGLKEITLPSSLQEMGDGAFYDCGGLERVTIEEGLKTIGSSAFNYCTSLEIVTIPESVTYIDAYAFQDCPITDVYYNGSAEQWAKIEINNTSLGNNSIINARKHFAK